MSLKRGCFPKFQNCDMSSFIVLSEVAGTRRRHESDCITPAYYKKVILLMVVRAATTKALDGRVLKLHVHIKNCQCRMSLSFIFSHVPC